MFCNLFIYFFFQNLICISLLHTFAVSAKLILETYILFFDRFYKQSNVIQVEAIPLCYITVTPCSYSLTQ